jgi:hypothetical protein
MGLVSGSVESANIQSYRRSMKRKIILVVLALLVIPALADDPPQPEPTQNPDATYRLYRTKNIYTLLKLDTRAGLIWQVQWGLDDEHRFVVPLNRDILLPVGTAQRPTALKSSRFTLCPTENIYTFVLLDQEDGRTWQVQWGDEKHRAILALP